MSMLNDSIREFLNGRHYAALATQNDDGSIHLTPVWYLFEDDRFYISSSSYARKSKNIEARPGVSVMVDSRRHQGDEKWVSVSGIAELISGEGTQEIQSKIFERYRTKEGLEDQVVGPVFAAAGDVIITLKPDSFQSWELKSVDDEYFGGVLRQTPDKWFHQVD